MEVKKSGGCAKKRRLNGGVKRQRKKLGRTNVSVTTMWNLPLSLTGGYHPEHRSRR